MNSNKKNVLIFKMTITREVSTTDPPILFHLKTLIPSSSSITVKYRYTVYCNEPQLSTLKRVKLLSTRGQTIKQKTISNETFPVPKQLNNKFSKITKSNKKPT